MKSGSVYLVCLIVEHSDKVHKVVHVPVSVRVLCHVDGAKVLQDVTTNSPACTHFYIVTRDTQQNQAPALTISACPYC